MSADDDSNIHVCAACGKEGEGMKKCNSCKEVRYCDVACQRAAWSGHKKACKRRAAELRDEALFQEHVPEECPICFLPNPPSRDEISYRSCCGKLICNGCTYGLVADDHMKGEMFGKCPFCRVRRASSDEGEVERLMKRMESNDGYAFDSLGYSYHTGQLGLPRDENRAIRVWLKAGELGCADGHNHIGMAYLTGIGVEKDKKKARHYFEMATMAGSFSARYNLGLMDLNEGKDNGDKKCFTRGLRHHAFAARAGFERSLKPLLKGYSLGYITKDEYERTLRAYQNTKSELKSEGREKFAKMWQLKSRRENADAREMQEIWEQAGKILHG